VSETTNTAEQPRVLVTYTDVLHEAARVFKVHHRDILGRAKYDFILPARFGLYKALHLRGNSYSQIGRWLDRDHATVRHGVLRATEMMKDINYFTKVHLLAGTLDQKERKGGR